MFLFFEGRVLEHLYSLWRKESELVDGSDEAEQGSHLLRGAARRNVRHLDHIGAGRHCGSVLWRTSTERHLNPIGFLSVSPQRRPAVSRCNGARAA